MRLMSLCLLMLTLSGPILGSSVIAADPPSPAAAMRRLLESGRAPQARIPSILRLICERGNASDLDFVVVQLSENTDCDASLKSTALEALENAAVQRKMFPTTEQNRILPLIDDENVKVQEQAVRLAGIWQLPESAAALLAIAGNPEAPDALKGVALKALNQVDATQAESLLHQLLDPASRISDQILAACILAPTKTDEAADVAVRIISGFDSESDPSTLLNAFLQLNNGSGILAERLSVTPPAPDVAKLMLRHIYSIGRADPILDQVLSKAAGIDTNAPPPTPEELLALVEAVKAKGNPYRGEQIFRRPELSCMNCHSINKAGGNIGPDLTAMGTSSPVDYLIMSILEPDQAIKEAYVTKVIVTADGRVHQGIVSGLTASTMTLRDATGKSVSIPVEDIDDEIEGKSLMPKGLTNFITQTEFIDLIAYLAELGKPGDFEIRSTPRIQRFQILLNVAPALLEISPSQTEFVDQVLKSDKWASVYAQANGQLPLSEIKKKIQGDVAYLSGELNCLTAGPALLRVETNSPVNVWLDEKHLGTGSEFPVEISEGRHRVVVRTDSIQDDSQLKIEVVKTPESSAEFVPVDGP